MKSIGVVQLIDSLNTGGAEVLAVNTANSLADKAGVNSFLCATRVEGKLKANIYNHVNYLFLGRKKTIDFRKFLTFKKFLKTNDISIIHAHATSSFFAFCIKLIYPKVKVVWHIHYGKIVNSSFQQKLFFKILSLFFQSIITVNTSLQKWASLNLYSKNIYFLNNFPVFNNLQKTTLLKGENDKRIVHLAGFREDKDHENLINAFHLFVKEEKNTKWTLHLVGKIHEGSYSQKIISLMKQYKLEKHIFTYGSCLDIKNILSQASIGVLTSKIEGLPLALLEYGLAKLPVITTNIGDCNKVILNNRTGFIVATENMVEFKEKLKILVNSEELRKSFGENLNEHVQENFSSKVFINKLIDIYKK